MLVAIAFAAQLAAADAATSQTQATLVLNPVAVADRSGRRVDESTVNKAAAALAKAASGRARVRAMPSSSASSSAPPRALPAELDKLAADARNAADELDTKNGVRLHRDLIGKLSSTLAEHGDVGALFDARVSLASLYLAMNEKALARAELDAAARLRPSAELDLSRWPPQMADAFGEAQARVRAEPGGDVDIAISGLADAGARAVAFVDGVRVGEAPLSVALRRGPHLVEAQAPGHALVRRVVDVEPGGRARVDERMSADPAFELEAKLRSELAANDRRVESVGLARSLGRVEKAANVVVTAVSPVDGGVLFVSSRVVTADEGGGEPRVVVATLDPSLSGAEATIAKALATLDEPAGAFAGGVSRVRGDNAPDPASIDVDTKKTLLGLVRTAASVAAATPVAPSASGSIPAHATQSPPAVVEESGGFPWLWVGGGVAVLAIAGGVTAAVLLLQPAPAPIQEPDRTVLTVGVAP